MKTFDGIDSGVFRIVYEPSRLRKYYVCSSELRPPIFDQTSGAVGCTSSLSLVLLSTETTFSDGLRDCTKYTQRDRFGRDTLHGEAIQSNADAD